MRLEARNQVCERVGDLPGSYKVSRSLTIDGHPYSAALECANPAFGDRILDDWERKTLEKIAEVEQQKAASC